MARVLGVPGEWSHTSQVHGNQVVQASEPGPQGEADALLVERPGLPIVVATADCVPVIIEADEAVAVVHAGWRGTDAGVVPAALEAMHWSGHAPLRAAIGPGIGPCCYEVGADVADRFDGFTATTTWGTTSVDIPGRIAAQLDGLEVWRSDRCTFTDVSCHSYRRDRTRRRQMAVGWLSAD